MTTPLKAYQDFVDTMVAVRPGVYQLWVKERGWPDVPDNAAVNDFLNTMKPEQREAIAQMVQDARDSAIFDVLVRLGDYTIISPEGVPLARDPYGNFMWDDWEFRNLGESWGEGEEPNEEPHP